MTTSYTTGTDRKTFLGFRVRTLIALVFSTVAISVAAIPYMPSPCGTVVEHGPTGPEPTVNIGRTVYACTDGTFRIVEWDIDATCGTVVENGTRMAASCSSEDELVGRMSAIHAERSGRTWEDVR